MVEIVIGITVDDLQNLQDRKSIMMVFNDGF